jgi:PAS domain S-box-containing protein
MSNDAIVSKSLDGIILSWNPAAERMFGYTAEEAVGSPISLIVPPERADEEPEILARLRRGEKVEGAETIRIRKDGKPIQVKLNISPLLDAQGKVMGALKIARDITDRNRAAEKVQLAEDRLLVTLKSIGDGVIVTDVYGYVEFMNPVAQALTGWDQELAKGKPLEAVFNIINETTRQRVESPVAKALREGVAVGLANHTILIAKDGTELAIDDSAAPIQKEGGGPSGVVLVFRDVTGQRAVENIRARLSAIVESSNDAIIGKDLQGSITSWNRGAEKMFGYTQQEAIGRPITMLIPPERLGEEVSILQRLRRGERVEHFETVRLAKGRRKVDVSVTVSPIHDGAGRVVGASKIARDITDRKRVERELEQAHLRLQAHAELLEREVAQRTADLRESLADLETFSSSLSHDLKTPLRAIAGHVQTLREDYGDGLPPEAQLLLQRVAATSSRLGRFVDHVLSYASLRGDDIVLGRVELDRLVPRVLEEYPHAHQTNAQVQIEAPLLAVEGHEGLLSQVVANLVSNAVKFVTPGLRPEVRIWTEPRERHVRLWVADNGIGIAHKDQERVFRLFTRLDGTGVYDGTGIGLAVVQRAMRRMGGRVGVESEPGKGSRFWVDLKPAIPLAAAA